MPPRQDIKKATEEKARQRRAEAARREAKQKKVEQAKRTEVGRKIKEENLEKNKRDKGVSIKEPIEAARKVPRAAEEDPKAKKKQKVGEASDLIILDPPTHQGPPSPPQSDLKSRNEGISGSVPHQTVYPRNPVQDAAPFIPKILIPSLEFPVGRPFTIQDTALNHPKEYLKGVLPPRDVNNARKNRMDDLCTSLMKSMISSTLYSMELIARAKSLHDKAGRDNAYINAAKAKEMSSEKEIKELRKQIEVANSKIKTTEEKAEATE